MIIASIFFLDFFELFRLEVIIHRFKHPFKITLSDYKPKGQTEKKSF